MSRFYPVFLNIEGKRCLIAGGGEVASRKAESLLACGAEVFVVAPEVVENMKKMIGEGDVTHIADSFKPEHMDGAALAFGCTDVAEVNRAVYEAAIAKNIPVNVVDQPGLCSFIVPSHVKRGDLSIAISTSGRSPAVAKKVRKSLEKQFGEEWAVYLEMMGEARETVLKTVDDPKRRAGIFQRLADSDIFDKIKEGDMDGAKRIVEEITGS